jgi:hypothetical protein
MAEENKKVESDYVKKRKKRDKKVMIIVWIVLGLFILGPLLFPGRFYMGASQGEHTGIVTAVEYNSHLTWGSNLVYFKTSTTSGQEDRYCVNDEAVKQQLIQFSKSHQEVTLYYSNDMIMWKWDCNGGDSIIYKVEKASP